MKRRARNLRDADIERIVQLLDTWTGPLTWERLIDATVARLGFRYSRAALHKHARVQLAFSERRRREKPPRPAALTYTGQLRSRIESLKERCLRLERENDGLLQQFVVWQYNAVSRGLSERDLNRPLTAIDRPGRRRVGPTMETPSARRHPRR